MYYLGIIQPHNFNITIGIVFIAGTLSGYQKLDPDPYQIDPDPNHTFAPKYPENRTKILLSKR